MPDRNDPARIAHSAATRTLAGFPALPPQVREELAQDATLRTVFASGVQHPARYASRVAAHLAIDRLRRRTEVLVPDPGDLTAVCPWERQMDARLECEGVLRLIAAGPRGHRETLRLLYLEDTNLREAVDLRVGADPSADPGLERDRWYKRRRRALTWIRAAVAEAA